MLSHFTSHPRLTTLSAAGLVLLGIWLLPTPGTDLESAARALRASASTHGEPAIDENLEAPNLPPGGLVSGPLGPPTSGTVTIVPILMYHYIRVDTNPRDRAGFALSVTPAMFHLQMQYLAGYGFHVISLGQAVEAVRLHRALPSRSIVLTFDDGYRDFYTAAAPELLKDRFPATVFVVSGFIERRRYLTWAMVQALDRLGFTIGDHTVDHLPLALLTPEHGRWEIQQSKSVLERELGHPVLDFAYPYGSFSVLDMALVQRAGFECAVTTLPGTRESAQTLMRMFRLRVGGGTSLQSFARQVGGQLPTQQWIASVSAAPAT